MIDAVVTRSSTRAVMSKYLLLLMCCALLPLRVCAQTSTSLVSASAKDTTVAPDAAELTKLLNDFLAGASRNDVAMHERFWANDLIYTGSSGRRIGKEDIMRDVREEAASAEKPKPDADVATYSAEDIRIQQYGTTAIVAFRLVGSTKKGETTEVANYLNTGTFLKRDGQWRAVSWQATKMPSAEAKK